MEELTAALPEGLPVGMIKEFEDSKRNALLIRHSFLDLRDNFRRIVDPPLQSSDGKGAVIVSQLLSVFCPYFVDISEAHPYVICKLGTYI